MKGAKLAFFICVCLAALAAGCVKDEEQPEFSLGVGDRVPAFSVTLNDGSVWSSTELRGRGAVLVFFNTSCKDCQRELPLVQAAYEASREQADAPDFMCIAREEDAGSIRAWWTEHGLTMPWSAQPDRAVYSLFATGGIPRVYVISPYRVITAASGPDDPLPL